MDPFEFADMFVGMQHRESETGSSEERRTVGIPQVVSGLAETDSSGGYVSVDLGGSSVTEDDWQAVEMPCDISVRAGDEVSVEIVDGKPRVVGRIGWGDALQAVADDAYSVATATNQHFWHDSNGAHVSTDAGDPEGASNSLWNSLGLLIRKASNYLVSITSSAIAFYDGLGNNASNIVASFGSSGATIGKDDENHVTLSSGGMTITAEDIAGVVQRTIAEFARRVSGIYNLQTYYESFLKLTDSGGGTWAELASGGTDSLGTPKYPSITSSIGLDILTDGESELVHIEAGDIIADGSLSLGSPLAVANGGTGADNASDARANLLAVGYQSGMNAAIASFSGANQMWGLRAKVLNTNNTSYYDHSTYILLRNNGVSCYDTTASAYPWQLTLPSGTTDLTINTHSPTLSNATATTFETRRQGSVVNLQVYQLKVTSSLADGSSVSLGSGIIGSNARPANVVYMPLVANVSGKGAGCFLSIGTGGNVTLYNRSGSALGTGTNLMGNTTWVI